MTILPTSPQETANVFPKHVEGAMQTALQALDPIMNKALSSEARLDAYTRVRPILKAALEAASPDAKKSLAAFDQAVASPRVEELFANLKGEFAKGAENAKSTLTATAGKDAGPTAVGNLSINALNLTRAMESKIMAMKVQLGRYQAQNNRLNDMRYLVNTAKNRLSQGQYKTLYDRARQARAAGDDQLYRQQLQAIRNLNEQFLSPNGAAQIQHEITNLGNQFAKIIAQNATGIGVLQTAISGLTQEIAQMRGIDKSERFALDTKSLSKFMSGEGYREQVRMKRSALQM